MDSRAVRQCEEEKNLLALRGVEIIFIRREPHSSVTTRTLDLNLNRPVVNTDIVYVKAGQVLAAHTQQKINLPRA